MSDTKTVVQGGGISFSSLLAVLFIGLKLTGYIAWPWVWVLSPLWIPLAIFLAVLAVVALIALILFPITLLITALSSKK